MSRIEALLDQGKFVIIQTFNERLPFYQGFKGVDTPLEAMQFGHVFLAVWHDQNNLYYVEAPWDTNKDNFIPYEPNPAIGIINKEQLGPAFSVIANYLTVDIRRNRLPDAPKVLKMVKELAGRARTNYGKKTETRDGLKVFYEKEAFAKLIEICGQESLSLDYESIPGKINLYRLLVWKAWVNIHRRKTLCFTLQKYASQWNVTSLNEIIEGLDKAIKAWENMIYFVLDKFYKNRYVLDLDLQIYFNRLAKLEEELFSLLEKIGCESSNSDDIDG